MGTQVGDGTFVGALRAERRFGGLTFAETTYRPGLVVAPHAHESPLVTLVLDGALTERRGSARLLCEQGSLLFQPPAEPHAHPFSEAGGRCFVLQFGSPWLGRMQELGLAQPGPPADMRRTRANWLAGEIYREFQVGDTAAELAMEGFALAMLGEVARARGRSETRAKPPWLIRAADLLHASLDRSLSMAEIAAAVGVHPDHLSRTFSEHYGYTMGEYLRRQRVERARRLLTETDRQLADVAYATGFADQAHFSRVFKRLTGTTPGAYRKADRPIPGGGPTPRAAP
jgi:AraC family transcriptional regulator